MVLHGESRMTGAGTVPVPDVFLEKFKLKEGDRVLFVSHTDGSVTLYPKNRPLEDTAGILAPSTLGRPLTVEEMDLEHPWDGRDSH